MNPNEIICTLKSLLNTLVQKESFEEISPPNIESKRELLFCMRHGMQDNCIAYFKHGELYDVSPRDFSISLDEDRQVAYDARYIISDGVKYDLENPESIKSIKIPKFNKINGMPFVTRDLGYIMKIKSGSNRNPKAIIPLIYKAANLMIASPISFAKKDYYQLISILWRIGAFEYGNHLEEILKKRLPFMTNDNFVFEESFDREVDLAKKYHKDLIEIAYSNICCSECAKYQARVYSISGKNKNFPKLPQHIIKNKGLHCKNSIYTLCLYGEDSDITIPIYRYLSNGDCIPIDVNAIKYSNRPFIDDRNSFEKEKYEEYIEKRAEEKQYAEMSFTLEHWKPYYYKHLEYQEIVRLLGDKAPKSYSGYMRMKKNNTTNYQKIAELAKAHNINIG